MGVKGCARGDEVSRAQLTAISFQLSALSSQLAVNSYQFLVLSYQFPTDPRLLVRLRLTPDASRLTPRHSRFPAPGPASPEASQSPHRAHVRCRAHHRGVLLAVECLREVGHVRQRADDSKALGRVRVRLDAQTRFFGTLDAAPDLRPSQEETLLRSEAVDRLRLLALLSGRVLFPLRFLERGVRDLEAPEVSD